MTRCARLALALLVGLGGLARAGPGPGGPGTDAAEEILIASSDQSQLLLRQGISLFDHGQYRQALGFFISALELDPKDEKAIYYQARAVQALSEERRSQLRKQGLELARNSLDQAERVKLAGILCVRAQAAVKSGDLVSAGRLYRESRAAFARHGCVAIGLMMTRQALEKRRVLAEASSEELQLLAAFSLTGEGAWSAATQARAQPAAAAAAWSAPAREKSLRRTGAKATFAELLAEPALGAYEARSAAEAPAKPTRRLVSSPQYLNASEELYLLAVADYMADDGDKARESLRKALALNPDNARAKTLLKRIRMEGE